MAKSYEPSDRIGVNLLPLGSPRPRRLNNHIDRHAYGVIYRLALGQNINIVHDSVIQESTKITDQLLEGFRPYSILGLLAQLGDTFERRDSKAEEDHVSSYPSVRVSRQTRH